MKMKDQYADYETARMLKDLNFQAECSGYYFKIQSKEDGEIKYQEEPNLSNAPPLFHNLNTHCIAPLWQQVEQWLWEHHGITIQVISTNGIIDVSDKWVWDVKKENKMLFYQHEIKYHDSPITAKIEGIKQAVKYLHSKLKQ